MDNNPLETKLHELRKQIDNCIKEVGKLKLNNKDNKPYSNQHRCQREVALSYTKLQEAKMWLGQALGAIGSKLPEQYRDEAK